MNEKDQRFELIKMFSKLYFEYFSRREILSSDQDMIAEQSVILADKVINEMKMKKS